MRSADSSYFLGLAWGVNINLHLGDTSRAGAYLSRLKTIDPTNTMVRAFTGVFGLADSIKITRNSAERCRLHVGIARLYDQITLSDEAFDEAEMAIREDSLQTD